MRESSSFSTSLPVLVKWYLLVVLICISLMFNDVEHLFVLMIICISSCDTVIYKTYVFDYSDDQNIFLLYI